MTARLGLGEIWQAAGCRISCLNQLTSRSSANRANDCETKCLFAVTVNGDLTSATKMVVCSLTKFRNPVKPAIGITTQHTPFGTLNFSPLSD
jgi:hypothetical protein